MEKKFYLSTKNKKIAGVCGGLAEYFGLDATTGQDNFRAFHSGRRQRHPRLSGHLAGSPQGGGYRGPADHTPSSTGLKTWRG